MSKKSNKKKKRRLQRIFGTPEPLEIANLLSRGPSGYDQWADIDACFKAIGHEPWEQPVSSQQLYKHSKQYKRTIQIAAHDDPQMSIQVMGDRRHPNDSIIDQVGSEYLTTASFHRAGQHVFRIWPALCVALLDTEVRVPSEMLQLPFPAFYIHFPLVFGDQLIVDNSDGTAIPADGAYVHMPGGVHAGDNAIAIRVMSRVNHPSILYDSNYHHYYVSREPEMLDEKSLREKNLWMANEATKAGNVKNFCGMALRLTINALLYINSSGADTRWGSSEYDRLKKTFAESGITSTRAKRERRMRALREASRVRSHDAGTTLRIPSLPGDGESHESGETWKLTHRSQVRGHWRNQPYGPGRADRKLLWIKPHYRGPEMSDVVARRTYDVVREDGAAVVDAD